MTEQEAIKKHIAECNRRIEVIKRYIKANKGSETPVCNENIAIMETVICLLEKQIPKKPVFEGGFIGVYKCPVCKTIVGSPVGKGVTYCPECGNAIKWKEGGLNG